MSGDSFASDEHFHSPYGRIFILLSAAGIRCYADRDPKTNTGGVVMGRTFPSIRQGVNSTADRWARSACWLKREDQKYGEQLAKMAKMYSSETFDACNDPLEAVVFSALVEIIKRQDKLEEDMKAGSS